MKYLEITSKNLNVLGDLCEIPDWLMQRLRILTAVFPFKSNNYVTSQLIDWKNIENDPVYKINFPQSSFLNDELRYRIESMPVNGPLDELRIIIAIRQSFISKMKKTSEENKGKFPTGLHLGFHNTMMLFPSDAACCHGICGYCYRWGIHKNEKLFSYSDPLLPVKYIENNKEITDVLVTGGDAFFMSAQALERYITPLLSISSLKTIRLATKVFSWWPYRFLTDDDTDHLIRFLRMIQSSGKNCAIMAHISHPAELQTDAVKKAIQMVKSTGAVIRSQTPLLANVNAHPAILVQLLNTEVELGVVPYYLFIESSDGLSNYYKLKPHDALRLCQEAIRSVSGLARTIRGPVFNQEGRKILMDGLVQVDGSEKLVLKCLQSFDSNEVGFIKLKDCTEDFNVEWL